MPERTFSRPESVRAFYSGRLELGQFNIDALKQYVCTVTHIVNYPNICRLYSILTFSLSNKEGQEIWRTRCTNTFKHNSCLIFKTWKSIACAECAAESCRKAWWLSLVWFQAIVITEYLLSLKSDDWAGTKILRRGYSFHRETNNARKVKSLERDLCSAHIRAKPNPLGIKDKYLGAEKIWWWG